MKKAVYKFYSECDEGGELEGILISTKQKVAKLIESKIKIYFGDVLGDHSEVSGVVKADELKFISD